MITASIIVDTRREAKKGFPLKIRVHDQINPHRYINLKIYQSEKELVRTPFLTQREFQLNQEIEYCNKNTLDLEQALKIIKDGIPDLNDLDSKIMLLEMELQRLKEKRNTTSFQQFYDIYINDRLTEGKSISTTVTRLNKFFSYLEFIGSNSNEFMINNLDYETLLGYKNYCLKNNVSANSVKGYFRDLKYFYKEAQKRKSLYIKSENPFEDFVFSLSKTKAQRAIELSNFKKFINLKAKHDKHIQTIDLIKFQFLIGGHDFVELSHLKWSDIKDGRINFHRFKNNHRGGGVMIDNILHPLALEIIDKHGTKDNERVFSFIPENILNENKYRLYLINIINNRIDTICKQNELDFKIRTKYIRYTFRTIGGNLMINQMILEKIMGHSNSSISMGYQGSTPYEIQDAEHLKIIDEVFG